MNTQTLDGRYVDKEKLVKLLKELFWKLSGQGASLAVFVREIRKALADRIINVRTLMITLSFQRRALLLK